MDKEIGPKYAIGGLIAEDSGDGVDLTGVVKANDEQLADEMMSHLDGHAEDLIGDISGDSDVSSNGSTRSFGMSGSWKGSTWVPEGPKKNWIDPKKLN